MAQPILLVDLSAIFWSAWHSSVNDAVSAATERTLAGIQRAIGQGGNRHVAICCDSGRSWRKDLAESYKAHRPEKDHAALEELRRIEERLAKDGLLLWRVPTFEADDIIATAVAMSDDADVLIATGDKDLCQLVCDRVKVLNTRDWGLMDAAAVKAKFKVEPTQLGDYLALVGDKSDGIAGAPGIGPVGAAAMLSAYGNLKGIFVALMGDGWKGKPATTKSLTENSDQIELARKLVALRTDVPINFAEIYERREQQPLREDKPMPDDMDAPDAELDSAPEISSPKGDAPPAAGPAVSASMSPGSAPVVAETAPPSANGHHASPSDATALTLRPVSYELQLEPTSLGTAHKLALGLYESRLYQRFNNAEAIWAVIIRGREMGLGALTSLDVFHVIEGKPAPHAMLIIARAKAHPDCEYFMCVETTPEYVVWETKNRNNPKPTRLKYTLEQAKKAGLIRAGSNWDKRPDEMIRKTGGVQLARIEYPDASMGLYAAVELGGEE